MDSPLVDELQSEMPAGEASAEVQDLIRRLVMRMSRGEDVYAVCAADDEADAILLDVEVDGVRCLLVRTHPVLAPAKETLSPREQEIARMVAKGYPNKTIAVVLDISTWTVGTYLRRIFAKLSVSSRAAMVARLMEEGQSRESVPHNARPGHTHRS